MKGTRVMTTATFYSALPAQRTSTQTSSKNSKIIYLPENPKIEDIQEHWDELITVAQLPKIMISVDVSSQMTPPLSQALTIDVCSSSS